MNVEDMPWRVGRSYGIHVYTDSGDKRQDSAVATFHDPEMAFVAVRDHNVALEARQAARSKAALDKLMRETRGTVTHKNPYVMINGESA